MVRTFNVRHGLIVQSTALIMLIEDNIDHTELIMRTAEEHGIPNWVAIR